MEQNFQTASAVYDVLKRMNKVPRSHRLVLYGLYKQAISGNVETDCPSILNFRRYQMWHSWNSYRGLSDSEAKIKYVEYILRNLVHN